jgi:hypothetical protein
MFVLDPRTCGEQAGGVTHTDHGNPVQVDQGYRDSPALLRARNVQICNTR